MSSDLSCVVHVHSTYSDGTATVAEIAAAARRSGAGAVLLADHDTLAARREECFHDDVLVLAGVDVTAGQGRLLAFGAGARPPGGDPRGVCRAVADQGGFGIAAHPFSSGCRMLPAFIADDALASLGGGALLVWWATRGWGTTRRISGRRLTTRTRRRRSAA